MIALTAAMLLIALTAAGQSVDPLILHPGPWCGDRMIVHQRSAGPGQTRRTRMLPRDPHLARAAAMRPEVRHVEASVPVVPLLDVSTSDSTLLSEQTLAYLGIAADGAQAAGWSGEGVLLAVIDNGFDLTHPDFLSPSGATRVAWLWDQTTSDNPSPEGFDYGSLWSGDEIDLGECTQTPQAHGTRVLGIASGNGSALPDGRYRGVAPLAGLLLVKTEGYTDQIADALAWIAATAASLGSPVSVNLSLGSHYGAHDGSRADELAIDEISGPGVIVTCAAGNSDGVPLHAQGVVPAVGLGDSVVIATGDYPQSSAPEGFGVDLWYPGGCALEVALRDPVGAIYGPVAMGDTLASDGDTGLIWLANDVDIPLNGDHHAVLLVTDDGAADSVGAGMWTLSFDASGSGVWHAWLFFRSYGAMSFLAADSTCTVIMPATAHSCLTAGGYLRDDGSAYAFSSRGPTRDGRACPDLCAPTAVHTATVGGGYTVFSGTSAAAPHLAGAAALALGRSPDLCPGDLRARVRAWARRDSLTVRPDDVPCGKWGWGKLYVEPLVRSFSILSIEAAGDTTLALTWQHAAGADTYEVYRDSIAFFAPDTLLSANRVAVLGELDDGGTEPGFQWTDSAGGVLVVDRPVAYLVRALKGEESWWSDNRRGAYTRTTAR